VPRTSVFTPDTPLSLVIGVTGHRDLRTEDLPRLEAVFEAALLDVHRRYPHSSAVLLSGLAEGADRLAALVALKLGVGLIVPMPLPQALYEKDFDTPESRDEFRDLLGRARGVIDLPLLPGITEEAVEQPGYDRDREYAKVGAYIARHSQIFFAFWDGTPDGPDKIGGTAHTVRFRLQGAPAPYTPHHGPLVFATTTGPLIHVETPRRSNPASQSLTCALRVIPQSDAAGDSFDQICRRMDLFNSDAFTLRDRLRAGDAQSTAYLLNTDMQSAPAVLMSLPASCRRIVGQYATADGLALHFSIRALSTWKWVSLGVAAAALFFNMHSSFFSAHSGTPASLSEGLATLPWFLILFLASSSFTAVWLYGRAEKNEYQTKYQDYRALAEALRIQFFWRLAGVAEPVVESYLRKQRSELEWIRSALRSCDVLTAAAASIPEGAPVPWPERLRFVTSWVKDQRRYFSSKARSEKEQLRKESTLVEWLLKLSGGLSIVLALLLGIPFAAGFAPMARVQSLVPSGWQHGAWMVIIPMLAVSAGLLHGYGQQLARPEHIRQFTRMSELFYAAEQELEKLLREGQQEAAVALVRDLGIEALDENGDWLILHRERPLEVPPG
jgi:hypothetical protein